MFFRYRVLLYGIIFLAVSVGLFFFKKKVEKGERSSYYVYQEGFGGWSIPQKLFDYIRATLPSGKTILELGSGWASGELSRYYTVYSVEHSSSWMNRYQTNYIYAPIKGRWYDVEVLKKNLPLSYDLIIVDGPPQRIGRYGFYKHLALFNTNVPILFDDINREAEKILMVDVASALGKDFEVFDADEGRKFGVIK